MEKIKLKAFVGRLNPVCTQSLESAAGLCMTNGHYEISVEQVLLKLLEQTTDLALILAHYDIDIIKFVKGLQDTIEDEKKGNAQKPVFSKTLVGLLEDAWLVASLELSLSKIRSGALALAILANPRRHGLSSYIDSLDTIPYDELKKQFLDIVADSCESSKQDTSTRKTNDSSSNLISEPNEALEKYCVNFTQQARDGKIDPVFCRDTEIRQMMDILARRRKNNPICVGDAGVGKTSVIEGLALKITEGDVPDMLKGVEVYALDLSLLQAGASVKGEFENRLTGVIDGVKSSAKPIILFIDEAHTLIGAGGAAGSGDAANLLKPALARGELRTIAATTWSEYKKYFEKDPALARRFQLVKLDEPTPEQATTIIRGLSHIYEKNHGVYIRDDAVVAAAQMSARYINGRQLPDKAVDVLDTASARVKMSLGAKPQIIDDLEREIREVTRERDAILRDINADIRKEDDSVIALQKKIDNAKTKLDELVNKWNDEKSLVDKILEKRHAIVEAGNDEQKSALKDEVATLKSELSTAQGDEPLVHYEVSPQVVGEVISNWTGVPVGKMLKDEASSVLTFKEQLVKRIKGQDHAIAAIDQGMRASKAGISNPETPMGVYLFVGPSGVGKTETCIGVADLLFGGERYLTSVNMSEFQEKHSVSRLIGSPPGYVGFGEGGMLTEAVRQKPYSVVLLDEVEKADIEVMNLFYQVFDKGVLSDGEGQLVDFKNTMLFLTSNLASDIITNMCVQADTLPSVEEITNAIKPVLSAHFKPALLARMQIVPFFPLGEEVIGDIVKLKLNKVKTRLAESQKLELVFGEDIIDAIARRCTEVDSGARNIDHILNSSLLPKLASDILESFSEEDGYTRLSLSLDDNGEFVTRFS